MTSLICYCGANIFAIRVNGAVDILDDSARYFYNDVYYWREIVSIKSTGLHIVGLRWDGTVVAAGNNDYRQCMVSDWHNIVSIAVGYSDGHTVGLKSDGTVVATGHNENAQCYVSNWRDITSIVAGRTGFTAGLKADGAVMIAGIAHKPHFTWSCDVSAWRDIAAITTGGGDDHIVGLKSDGTVISTMDIDTSNMSGVTALAPGLGHHIVGIRTDGTVAAAGPNNFGECDVYYWQDIVAITGGRNYTIGLRRDGTVVATGDNSKGQCDVSHWRDIIAISTDSNLVVGVKSDGTVVATGANGFSASFDVSKLQYIGYPTEENILSLRQYEWSAYQQQQAQEQARLWQSQGLCPHCGGQIGGIFTKKCKNCGKS